MSAGPTGFDRWDLESHISKAISERGWEEPTEIQIEAIPHGRKGRDVVGQARTGSGKTAAFGIPAIERCSVLGKIQAIILCPTRELAVQVSEEMGILQGEKGLKIETVYGGTDIDKQAKRLDDGADIVVGTPGRVIDMAKRGHLKMESISLFCLDEADRMLDMGFIPAMRRIHAELPKKRQTLMFSATFSREIESLAGEFLHQPQKIQVTPANTTVSRIDQTVYPVDKTRKTDLLKHLVTSERWGQVLVFSRTKHGADKISRKLCKAGISSDSIHGDKTQGSRTRSLKQFKDGRLQVLVATDIAARGIDIQQLPRVVNFDLPHVAEDYVHRIGRTGRAGETGIALSLVSADEVSQLQKIEKLIKKSIPREEIDGFEPEHRLPTKPVKTSGKRLPKKAKAKPGAKKHREGQGKKRQGGPSAQRQGRAAKRGGRNRKPARARA